MKHISIGKYAVPSWILGAALASICICAFALYMALMFTIPFEVKEPIEVLYHPSQLSLYPGDTLYFNVTVRNNASHNYTVYLDFSLDNTTYQNSYVTFSNTTYLVRPGVQNLTAWVIVAAEAPPKNALLTVSVFREASRDSGVEQIQITVVEFLGSGTTIRVTVNNTGTVSVIINEAWVNDAERTTNPPLPQTILPNDGLTIDIESPWVPGYIYVVKVVSSRGNQFSYAATATGVLEGSLQIYRFHVWHNGTTFAEAAFLIINTGARDVVIDKISVRGQECSWNSVYYNKTKDTISNDLTYVEPNANSTLLGKDWNGYSLIQASDDLILQSGCTMIVFITDPDHISVSDIGVTIGLTIFTANALYYIETNVEHIESVVILYKENVRFYEESGMKKIDVDVGNSGTSDTQIIQVYIETSSTNLENQTTTPALPVVLAAGSVVKITILYTWDQATVYYFKVEASTTES